MYNYTILHFNLHNSHAICFGHSVYIYIKYCILRIIFPIDTFINNVFLDAVCSGHSAGCDVRL